ncbi:hypothetical protein P43SY_005346 [Pythium insidiosum]|uniref:Uncharacterized protein n=1 Tax=Pythium insidiosum TaxID=114742 RepID=A0AAD5M766_PYTIN|nr:hypothetical protein P43SY_005346 [Pythium insidiosum]
MEAPTTEREHVQPPADTGGPQSSARWPLPFVVTRAPFSPPDMGRPLPFLDVFSVQSKRMLSVPQRELLAQRREHRKMLRRLMAHLSDAEHSLKHTPRCDSSATSSSGSSSDEDEDDDEEEDDEEDGDGQDNGKGKGKAEDAEETERPTDHSEHPSTKHREVCGEDAPGVALGPHQEEVAGEDSDEDWGLPLTEEQRLRRELAAVRLLVEPILLPDLHHSGVAWQFPSQPDARGRGPRLVTVPNHTAEETNVQLFYPTGAKNTNMRDYIKDVIEKHKRSPPKRQLQLQGSESAPALSRPLAVDVGSNARSPAKRKQKKPPGAASPYKSSAPDARSHVPRSPASRLAPTFANSALLNPELTRQARDVLAQLRANANKLQDLIGN